MLRLVVVGCFNRVLYFYPLGSINFHLFNTVKYFSLQKYCIQAKTLVQVQLFSLKIHRIAILKHFVHGKTTILLVLQHFLQKA